MLRGEELEGNRISTAILLDEATRKKAETVSQYLEFVVERVS
jgi:hypothetical protein